MDLWIRSQDRKRLIKVKDIYVVEDKSNSVSYVGNTIVGHLGQYKNLDRALEILDEIQKILFFDANYQGSYEWIDIQIKGLMTKSMIGCVYQMPKE